MSRRVERVASLIRSIVADAIQARLSDPRIEPLTSITRVEVSPDFSTANIYVSVMADEAHRKLCVTALQHAAGRLRTYVAEGLSLRIVPRLIFRLDDSVRRGTEMVIELDRLMAELGDRQTRESTSSELSDAPDIGARDVAADGGGRPHSEEDR